MIVYVHRAEPIARMAVIQLDALEVTVRDLLIAAGPHVDIGTGDEAGLALVVNGVARGGDYVIQPNELQRFVVVDASEVAA